MNIGGVLITNDSDTHPPESWAAATASMIFEVDNNISGPRRIQAMALQVKLAEALVKHHKKVQDDESALLHADPSRHESWEHDIEDGHMDQVVQDVMDAAKGTPWEADFHHPDMAAKIRKLVGDHFATAQHIHRQAHRKRMGKEPMAMHPGEHWAAAKAAADKMEG